MKVSVIIPSRNDTVMLGITIRSALEELKAVNGGGEVVVCDNSDEDIWKIITKPNKSPIDLLSVYDGKVKILRQKTPGLWAARQSAIRHASGEYVFNLDSHMILGRDVIKSAVDFMDNAPNGTGMGHVPLGWVTKPEGWARHDIRQDRGCLYNAWGKQYEEPTTMAWGYGFRIYRKDWFFDTMNGYGCFAKEHLSWGGGEFYFGIKSWLLGYKTYAIPANPVYHVGPFSEEIEKLGYRYRTYGSSGNGKVGMGILVALYALGGEDAIEEARRTQEHLTRHGIEVERDWAEAKRIALNDWLWLKERQVLSLNDLIETRPWQADGWKEWKPEGHFLNLYRDAKLVEKGN